MSIATEEKQKTIHAALAALRDRYVNAESEDFNYVLFGAGQCGRLILDAMCPVGLRPAAFADNNQTLWGSDVNGVPVYSPAEAFMKHQQATFVVAVRGPHSADVYRQLAEMGITRVANDCAWMIPPPDCADGLADVWADEKSQRECLAMLNWRLGCREMPPHELHDEMYFPRDLFQLGESEVFFDLGAYDGDTFIEFRQRAKGFWSYVGFEPDSHNYARLDVAVCRRMGNCNVRLFQMAVSNNREGVSFRATGDVSSRVSADGNATVSCARLDDMSFLPAPTFLKADIEGSELSALQSGERLIRQHRPILAVCLYHKPQDLWEIPLWIDGLRVGYRLYLRRYGPDDTELVCYAIPEERDRNGR